MSKQDKLAELEKRLAQLEKQNRQLAAKNKKLEAAIARRPAAGGAKAKNNSGQTQYKKEQRANTGVPQRPQLQYGKTDAGAPLATPPGAGQRGAPQKYQYTPPPRPKTGGLYKAVKSVNILLVIGLCVCSLVFTSVRLFGKTVQMPRNESYELYKDLLNEDEQTMWLERPVEQGKGALQMNTAIPVNNDGVTARAIIVNPPYSAYACEVEIVLGGETIYKSELLQPGTAVEYVTLYRALHRGDHAATAQYTFYEGNAEKGQETVELTLQVADYLENLEDT